MMTRTVITAYHGLSPTCLPPLLLLHLMHARGTRFPQTRPYHTDPLLSALGPSDRDAGSCRELERRGLTQLDAAETERWLRCHHVGEEAVQAMGGSNVTGAELVVGEDAERQEDSKLYDRSRGCRGASW